LGSGDIFISVVFIPNYVGVVEMIIGITEQWLVLAGVLCGIPIGMIIQYLINEYIRGG